jgi:hypothetical protein
MPAACPNSLRFGGRGVFWIEEGNIFWRRREAVVSYFCVVNISSNILL